MSGSTPVDQASLPEVPSLKRRIACLPYEGLLLLALLLIAAFPAAGTHGGVTAGWAQAFFQAYLVAVVACYFVWFWTHGGQTLPMKTWRIRVVRLDGQPLNALQALWRFACASAFFMPACVAIVLFMFPQRVSPAIVIWLTVPALATILWARFDDDRQFLHDRLARTRLLSAS